MASVLEPVLDHAAAERARLVNESRARLLRSGRAVTLGMIADATGRSVATVRQWVNRRRNEQRMIAVLHDSLLYIPTFQLDEAFDLRDDASEIVSALLFRQMSDWAVWTWFETPSPWLAERRSPAQALAEGDREALDRAVLGLLQG